MVTEEEVEAGAKAIYGKGWDGPPEKQPGNRMKDVWRDYARKVIQAVDDIRNQPKRISPLRIEDGDS